MQEKGKGVANVSRQTWDKEYYEKKAQMRASGQLEEKEVRLFHCIHANPRTALVCDASRSVDQEGDRV